MIADKAFTDKSALKRRLSTQRNSLIVNEGMASMLSPTSGNMKRSSMKKEYFEVSGQISPTSFRSSSLQDGDSSSFVNWEDINNFMLINPDSPYLLAWMTFTSLITQALILYNGSHFAFAYVDYEHPAFLIPYLQTAYALTLFDLFLPFTTMFYKKGRMISSRKEIIKHVLSGGYGFVV